MITFQLDTARLEEKIRQLMVIQHKEAKDAIMGEGKLLARDLVRGTPPHGKHPFSESFAFQRRIGIAAVTRQIRGLFPRLMDFGKPRLFDQLDQYPRARKYVNRYIRQRNAQALNTMFRDLKIYIPNIVSSATPALHAKSRNSEGRVVKGLQYPVIDVRSRERLLKDELKKVGSAKAGWAEPAAALGVRLPHWILDHNHNGVWRNRTDDPVRPFIELGNMVSNAVSAGAREDLLRLAYQNRQRSLDKRVDIMIRHMKLD